MVVVAPGGEKRRLVAEPLLELEAEHVAVEVDRPVEVRDLQVDVPDVDAGIDRLCHSESVAPARIQTT